MLRNESKKSNKMNENDTNKLSKKTKKEVLIKKKDKHEEENKVVETRTIERLLKDLRVQRDWSYWNVVEELTRKGTILNEKTIKKWEYGLEYPDLDTIYKLAEIYNIPSERFVTAKNNSFKEGFETIHMEFIKRICYATGISLKIGYIGMYVIIGLVLIGALMFFVGKCNEYLLVRSMMN